jgi:hypothetical protein
MFEQRHMSEMVTCMCWGFACGDGWFNIIDQLCGNIQHHIDWKEKQRKWALDYNEMAGQAKAGNFDLFEETMKALPNDEFKEKRLAEIVAGDFREVPESIPQVVVTQVKEKFGTLRFYYDGGDDYISGMVTMAESMSGVTCEECGASAKTSSVDPEKGITGWVHTTCQPCQNKRKRERDEFVVDSLKNDIL